MPFQLTTSRRGRPAYCCATSLDISVSTHDLTKRSTHASNSSAGICIVSTHDLTKRSTWKEGTISPLKKFQLTTSRRGRRHSRTGKKITEKFQLTTSRRGRPDIALPLTVYARFNSRPHEEVDDDSDGLSGHTLAFQLTTSRRGRPSRFRSATTGTNAFQLTTSRRGRLLLFGIIAIYASFNSRPHEEVDRLVSENTALDFLFQLTTSRRGRHIVTVGHFKTYDVSTHDLTKRSTLLIQALLLAFSFQLTTSRRGRLVTLSHDAVLDMCFNSRPHEEVDGKATNTNLGKATFQLTTSRRGRQYAMPSAESLLPCFNSRPHEEVD